MGRNSQQSLFAFLTLACLCSFFGTILTPSLVTALDAGSRDAVEGIVLIDDADRQSLITAALRQAEYLKSLPAKKQLGLGERTVAVEDLRTAMASFLAIVTQEQSSARISQRLREELIFYPVTKQSTSGEDLRTLVTGYFEPVLPGSLIPVGSFIHPIYSPPADLVSTLSGDKIVIRRKSSAGLVPYWTRSEIDNGSLLAGSELVYLKDPVEAFILHVQGSGKIQLPDGSLRSVQFAASNGHPYRSIGKLLVDEGRLTLEEATLPGIEKYLRDHPEDVWRVLHANQRYIFFNLKKDEAAVRGSTGTALTPGRSIAVDPSAVPLGSIAFLTTQHPLFDETGHLKGWKRLQRFVFPQDTGAAIKGPDRIDLFLGSGREARLAAGLMRENGTLHILLKKNSRGVNMQ